MRAVPRGRHPEPSPTGRGRSPLDRPRSVACSPVGRGVERGGEQRDGVAATDAHRARHGGDVRRDDARDQVTQRPSVWRTCSGGVGAAQIVGLGLSFVPERFDHGFACVVGEPERGLGPGRTPWSRTRPRRWRTRGSTSGQATFTGVANDSGATCPLVRDHGRDAKPHLGGSASRCSIGRCRDGSWVTRWTQPDVVVRPRGCARRHPPPRPGR